ncbi:hypothetical protein TBR22_A03620 [Luteitalea sp. TBR-22]|uniref:hypothetical protein n=1 Tax=Luteitalea sp. TBR-22 TaxID=2802971 RepID=UPI001AF6E31C|nr:hypothetical protein [Luteitalea sp. TBR-22]BCS31162.1 hypothetical protein TBR22_A03620 [Luteitalea sp. TBR-22]
MSRHTCAAIHRVAALAACLALLGAADRPPAARVHRDSPLTSEPETQDARGARPVPHGRLYEVARDLTVTRTSTPTGTRALNVNSIDDVPDSSWFTNQARDVPESDEVLRPATCMTCPGAAEDAAPTQDASLQVVAIDASTAPRLTARDADGAMWDVVFDPVSHPETVTGTTVVVATLLRQVGYHHARWSIVRLRPHGLQPAAGATITTRTGRVVPLRPSDIAALLRGAAPHDDGTYRAAVARRPPGVRLGAFRFRATRPDDPNDVIPHEHRRELRALRVVGAWLNLTRLGPRMTQDVLQPRADGRHVIRHYLEGAGMGLGVADGRPHGAREGIEYLYDPGPMLQRLWTFGLRRPDWHAREAPIERGIGRVPADGFDPRAWRPLVPNQAFVEMRSDDASWAARRIVGFTDARLREVVALARYSSEATSRRLVDLLASRRDAIGRAWLTADAAVTRPALALDGTLTYADASVEAGLVERTPSRRIRWGLFDNETGTTTRRGAAVADGGGVALPEATSLPVGSHLWVGMHDVNDPAAGDGSVDANGEEEPAVTLVFRRGDERWTLVSLERRGPHRVEP